MRRLLRILPVLMLCFTISCGIFGSKPGDTGTVKVVVTTDGNNQDNSYMVSVADKQKNIPAEGEANFEDVETGTRTVRLSDVADNCYVADSKTKSVEVSTETPGTVGYRVTCEATSQ